MVNSVVTTYSAYKKTIALAMVFMVETTGIEPVTPCMSSKYSNQLSYASKCYEVEFEDLHEKPLRGISTRTILYAVDVRSRASLNRASRRSF